MDGNPERDERPESVGRDGRTAGWRIGMLSAAAVLGGAGYAVLKWPQLIVWAIAGVFFAGGALLAVSALLARGRRG